MNKEQNTFPFIERLLDGAEVEWKPLGEISEIYGGLTGKSKSDFENGNALFVSYKNIYDHHEINTLELSKVKVADTEQQHKIEYGDILFTGSSETAEDVAFSSAVTIHFNESVYLNSFSFGVRFHKNIVLIPEFSKYLFRGLYLRKQLIKTANGVTRFNVSKALFKKILIPIPPLSVQERIIEILDKFTTLEAELEAELDCRKRQYEFYRNQLLSFEYGAVEWKKLGEVCDFKNGFAFKSNLFKEKGLPIIRISNITGTSVDVSDVKYFDIQDYHKNGNPLDYSIDKGDVLIAMSGATTAKIGYYDKEETAYQNQRVGKFIPQKNILNSRFLYHFLQTRIQYMYNLAGGGAQPNLSSNDIKKKIIIPLPPLTEQQRIVSILDKFDTLTTSISEGLPKEIELRRKQYEYYRERLLSFGH